MDENNAFRATERSASTRVLGCVTSSCDITGAEGLIIIGGKKGTNILTIREGAASDNRTERPMRGSPDAGEDKGLS